MSRVGGAMRPEALHEGTSRSGDRAAKGMPRPRLCTRRLHPATGTHLPSKTLLALRGRASFIAPYFLLPKDLLRKKLAHFIHPGFRARAVARVFLVHRFFQ